MKVPNSYWAEAAFAAAAYLLNRTPTPVTENVSPLQRLTNRVPSYDHLRVFGCRCFVLLPLVIFAAVTSFHQRRLCVFAFDTLLDRTSKKGIAVMIPLLARCMCRGTLLSLRTRPI